MCCGPAFTRSTRTIRLAGPRPLRPVGRARLCTLYALLHLTGYDLPLEELKRFRQWGSRTPGHPEYGKTPGVEVTTGPLGQGLANAVGMAIAEVALAARFNRPGHPIVDHHTYVLASDGDLEEGISSEAGSEAGHLRLGKLIVLYADNHITIEGSTDLAFTEDRIGPFAAFGWHVQRSKTATHLRGRCSDQGRPGIHRSAVPDHVRTHIGFGSPHKQDTAAAHGEPLGSEEARLTKEAPGWPADRRSRFPGTPWSIFAKGARGEVPPRRIGSYVLKLMRRNIPSWRRSSSGSRSAASHRLGRRPSEFNPADGPMATRLGFRQGPQRGAAPHVSRS